MKQTYIEPKRLTKHSHPSRLFVVVIGFLVGLTVGLTPLYLDVYLPYNSYGPSIPWYDALTAPGRFAVAVLFGASHCVPRIFWVTVNGILFGAVGAGLALLLHWGVRCIREKLYEQRERD